MLDILKTIYCIVAGLLLHRHCLFTVLLCMPIMQELHFHSFDVRHHVALRSYRVGHNAHSRITGMAERRSVLCQFDGQQCNRHTFVLYSWLFLSSWVIWKLFVFTYSWYNLHSIRFITFEATWLFIASALRWFASSVLWRQWWSAPVLRRTHGLPYRMGSGPSSTWLWLALRLDHSSFRLEPLARPGCGWAWSVDWCLFWFNWCCLWTLRTPGPTLGWVRIEDCRRRRLMRLIYICVFLQIISVKVNLVAGSAPFWPSLDCSMFCPLSVLHCCLYSSQL